jgi:hypothetical protein
MMICIDNIVGSWVMIFFFWRVRAGQKGHTMAVMHLLIKAHSFIHSFIHPSILGYDNAWSDRWVPMFWRSILPLIPWRVWQHAPLKHWNFPTRLQQGHNPEGNQMCKFLFVSISFNEITYMHIIMTISFMVAYFGTVVSLNMWWCKIRNREE